jgi:hypothetical protein
MRPYRIYTFAAAHIIPMGLRFSVLLLLLILKWDRLWLFFRVLQKVCIFNIKLYSKHEGYINTSEQAAYNDWLCSTTYVWYEYVIGGGMVGFVIAHSVFHSQVLCSSFALVDRNHSRLWQWRVHCVKQVLLFFSSDTGTCSRAHHR